MEGKFSKIRGRFDSRIPVTTTEDQITGRWERATDPGHKCESIDNQQQKTRVVEDLSGIYQW